MSLPEPQRTESGSRTFRLAMKELREILRDRRTVLTLVLMPLLVYPLLGVIMRNGVLANASLTQQGSIVRVCFETHDELSAFEYEMAGGKTILLEAGETDESRPASDSSDLVPSAAQPVKFEVYVLSNSEITIRDAIRNGQVDLGIRITSCLLYTSPSPRD